MDKIMIDTNLSAKEISEQYGCSKTTAYKAKQRGYLFDANYYGKIPATKKQLERFLRIAALPEIAITGIAADKVKAWQVRNEKTMLYQDEYREFEEYIVKVQVALNKFIDDPVQQGLLSLCKNKSIKHTVLFIKIKRLLNRAITRGQVIKPEKLKYAKKQAVKLMRKIN